LADKIEQAVGIKARLFKGRTGSFEVVADDELIFSKLKEGHFPSEDAVLSSILNR
jgi:selT/selW/selH-like putative selenoprotein